jgi:hypothetical protein
MSSVHLGVLPDTVGPTFDRIDWIPIDQLASMLVELAVQPPPSNGTAAVYHLQNPHPTTWASMLPDLVHAIRAATGKSVSPVPAARWLQRLRENDVDPHAASDHLRAAYATNPGLALLDTYAELMNETTAATVLELGTTTARSTRLRALDGINSTWLHKWVHEWFRAAPLQQGAA